MVEGGGMVEGGVTIKPPGNNHRSPAPKTRIEQLINLYCTVRVYIYTFYCTYKYSTYLIVLYNVTKSPTNITSLKSDAKIANTPAARNNG